MLQRTTLICDENDAIRVPERLPKWEAPSCLSPLKHNESNQIWISGINEAKKTALLWLPVNFLTSDLKNFQNAVYAMGKYNRNVAMNHFSWKSNTRTCPGVHEIVAMEIVNHFQSSYLIIKSMKSNNTIYWYRVSIRRIELNPVLFGFR